MSELKTVGRNVRIYREARGWTQDALARRATTCKGTVWRIENGRAANANTLRRIARALGVKLRALEAVQYEGDERDSAGCGESHAA